MRVALAIAALVAVPMTAAADEPAGSGAGSGTGPTLPTSPAPTLPANPPPARPAGTAPSETPSTPPSDAPPVDPAYGDRGDGDVRNFPAPRGKDVIITAFPERSNKNMLVLGSLAAGGAIAGAIGLYFHLDARSASDEVSANKFTGEPWTPALEATYDRAQSSSVKAGVFYGIGGALVLASAIAYIATEPKPETMVIHPHVDPKPTALVAPTRGGAMVGGAWSF